MSTANTMERLAKAIADLQAMVEEVCTGITAGWLEDMMWSSTSRFDREVFALRYVPDSAHDAMRKASFLARHRATFDALEAALPPAGPRLSLGFEVVIHSHGDTFISQTLRTTLADQALVAPNNPATVIHSYTPRMTIPAITTDHIRDIAECAMQAHAMPACATGPVRWVVASTCSDTKATLRCGVPGAASADEALRRVLEHHAIGALAAGCAAPHVAIEQIAMSDEHIKQTMSAARAIDPASPVARIRMSSPSPQS